MGRKETKHSDLRSCCEGQLERKIEGDTCRRETKMRGKGTESAASGVGFYFRAGMHGGESR